DAAHGERTARRDRSPHSPCPAGPAASLGCQTGADAACETRRRAGSAPWLSPGVWTDSLPAAAPKRRGRPRSHPPRTMWAEPPRMSDLSSPDLSPFRDLLGEGGLITDAGSLTRYTHDQRALMQGQTPGVLRPRSTEEVQAIVGLAARLG